MSENAVPKPLSAYVGLVLASIEDARGAGGSPIAQVVRLPLATAGQLITARARYDELAEQGDVVLDVVVGGVKGMLRSRFGSAADNASEQASNAFDDVSEAADSAGEWLMDTADTAVDTVRSAAESAAAAASDISSRAAASLNGSSDESDDVTSFLEAVEDDDASDSSYDTSTYDTDTTDETEALTDEAEVLTDADVEAAVEAATEPDIETPLQRLENFTVPEEFSQPAAATGLLSAAELPIEDFDHMSLPQLRGRLRRLDGVQLVQLLNYERAHAGRVGILTMLENRISKLETEAPTDVPLI